MEKNNTIFSDFREMSSEICYSVSTVLTLQLYTQWLHREAISHLLMRIGLADPDNGEHVSPKLWTGVVDLAFVARTKT